MKNPKNSRPEPSVSGNSNPTAPRQAETAAKRDFEGVPLEVNIDTLRQWNLEAEGFSRLLLADVLTRVYRLFERIEQAYAGQPFLPGIAPDSAPNQQRAKAHFEDLRRATELLHDVCEVERTTRPTKVVSKDPDAKKPMAKTTVQPGTPVVKDASEKSPDVSTDGSRSRQKETPGSAGENRSTIPNRRFGREFDIEM